MHTFWSNIILYLLDYDGGYEAVDPTNTALIPGRCKDEGIYVSDVNYDNTTSTRVVDYPETKFGGPCSGYVDHESA